MSDRTAVSPKETMEKTYFELTCIQTTLALLTRDDDSSLGCSVGWICEKLNAALEVMDKTMPDMTDKKGETA